MKHILIIGPGRAGSALESSFRVHSDDHIVRLKGRNWSNADILWCDTVFITTPDRIIPDIVDALNEINFSRKKLIHMSGSLDAAVFEKLAKGKHHVACMHPMKAITDDTDDLSGIYFDLQGDEELCNELGKLINSWDSKYIVCSAEQKAMLHIASVFVSNYAVTLMDIALSITGYDETQSSHLKDALLMLMQSSLNNLKAMSTEKALTGPIQRGEIGTIDKHLKMLSHHSGEIESYRELALRTLPISKLDESKRKALEELLS